MFGSKRVIEAKRQKRYQIQNHMHRTPREARLISTGSRVGSAIAKAITQRVVLILMPSGILRVSWTWGKTVVRWVLSLVKM